MQKRFRQLFTCVKEHSSVGLAKVATAGGFCDVDLIIVKATAPDDLPLSEKYVNELLKIFSISPSSFRTFSLSFTRRFGKTHCWRVALKCLLLLHRLLRSLPENSPFRSYAQLLDEALDCVALDSRATYDEEEEEVPESLSDKMKEVRRMIEVLPQLQSLIDRVIDCRPHGIAARNFLVKMAMKHIIRDSFISYTTFRREIVLVLDNLFQMPYRSCILAFGIYKKASMQANQLCEFYDWCKALGFCGAYEYPFIDRIPKIQIQALETFLNGMWQLTESSSPGSSRSSFSGSPSSMTATVNEEGDCRQIVRKDTLVCANEWEKFEENEFRRKLEGEDREPLIQFEDEENDKPLIKFEDEENDNWEELLDASVNLPCLSSVPQSNFFVSPKAREDVHEYGVSNSTKEIMEGDKTGWKIQVFDTEAVANPFNQLYNVQYYHVLRRM
ncbi:Clathrin assembly protein [Melia azedarach]|uniref:Clathrin assembly protein n=1 Tax=Melia azedarach TaxID=155640 RepID=A0ACC1XFH9_MELAZ|nr:Clathrin assembly protein [Melia azedarach]